ncbi:hypothetical protein [Fluoribacter gormanii]|uniref:hypothetical protein n=1 Tax=Fluoribacter gormanii TaxID=464 RepID=UPI0013EFB728|nr:hypothetical protein [Fluoribacter gormanii]
MIYLTIPSGMVFKKVAVQTNNSSEAEQISDCFVNPEERKGKTICPGYPAPGQNNFVY